MHLLRAVRLHSGCTRTLLLQMSQDQHETRKGATQLPMPLPRAVQSHRGQTCTLLLQMPRGKRETRRGTTQLPMQLLSAVQSHRGHTGTLLLQMPRGERGSRRHPTRLLVQLPLATLNFMTRYENAASVTNIMAAPQQQPSIPDVGRLPATERVATSIVIITSKDTKTKD